MPSSNDTTRGRGDAKTRGRRTAVAPSQAAALCAVAAVGLGGWVAGAALGDADRCWRAMLIAFIYLTPLAGGAVVWSAIVTASKGRWAAPIERPALAGLGFAPISLAMLAALWLGAEHWARWVHHVHGAKAAWLNPHFLFPRDLLALAGFWAAAGWYVHRRRHSPARAAGGVLILVYALVFTLLGFDLVMALDPHWFSSLFGGYFFISGLYIAMAGWVAVSAASGDDACPLSDLGKLLLAMSMLTTYMMFSQLLPIWYENLPHEVRFLIPRMELARWGLVSILLLATIYLGPLTLLLSRRIKRSGRAMGAIAALILAGMWIERWWLVTPTAGGPITVGWQEISIVVAGGALLLLAGRAMLSRLPDELPSPPEGQS